MSESSKHEEEILKFWEDNQIYKKSKEKNKGGDKFYFMDGPPYATGKIHMGTALNKTLKDIAMRSQRMQGKDVFDRPGYDTHGVPIEFQIEKEIGSKGKKDIEKYGVKNFIHKCREFATRYIDVMNSEFKNLGVWLDFENPYITLSNEYIETIWDTFKVADKKGLLYLGKYSVHVCPRCETAVAFNEIEYGKQKDTSVFVKFPLKDKKNTFLIIWTTTPWTLPANMGVMAHPDFEYAEIEISSGEKWIIAKELVAKIMGKLEMGFTVKKTFKGKEMDGWTYENPLSKNLKLKIDPKKNYKVVLSGRYVNLEDGTGLVHCAPGHGREDYEVGRENDLEISCPVGINGIMTEEAGKYAGGRAREIDKQIIEDLKSEGYLVYKHEYEHDYPLCWRDKMPLLMLSLPQWFLKVSAIRDNLLKENDKNNWIPKWMSSRMKAWLEGLSDWPISRQRYWGTPLPIWISEDGKEKIVVGSIEELEELSGKKLSDLHKPEIDSITIKSKTGKVLKRVPEVLDVWFDSGVSSWAALDYPRDEKTFKKFWPADLNIEGRDMVRGWWNSQMILSQVRFDKKPFNSIVTHGLVLALGKVKMSKSLGNIVSPQEVIEKYSRDLMRYYFARTSKGEDFDLDDDALKDVQKVLIVLNNTSNYINLLKDSPAEKKVEDEWIISKYNHMVREATEAYNNYLFSDALQIIEKFLVMDVSRGYIQLTRERSDETKRIVWEIYKGVLQLLSPIIPFTTEKIWQATKKPMKLKEESIHLSGFPKVNEKFVNTGLEGRFGNIFQIIEAGMRERDKQQVGLKWPLKSLEINSKFNVDDEMKEVIMRQLNVKQIIFEKTKEEELSIHFDFKMTRELEAEGFSREISRAVQAERKKLGLVKTDLVNLEVVVPEAILKNILKFEKFIKERTNSKNIDISDEKSVKKQYVEFKARNQTFYFHIERKN